MKRLLFITALILPFNAFGEDAAELRAAAERYDAVAGIGKMLHDTNQSLASRLPEDKRDAFIQHMEELVDAEALRTHALETMVQHFTAVELNAMAEFYGTQIGQSILDKFSAYNAVVTPKVMQVVLSAAEEARLRVEN